jgi:hypothetical protein
MDSELGGRREIQQFLEFRHVVYLAAPFQNVDALLGGDHRIAVKISGTLLELRKILYALERALRAEEPLDVHTAETWRVDLVFARTGVKSPETISQETIFRWVVQPLPPGSEPEFRRNSIPGQSKIALSAESIRYLT